MTDTAFDKTGALLRLARHYQLPAASVAASSFPGCESLTCGFQAAGGLLDYIEDTHRTRSWASPTAAAGSVSSSSAAALSSSVSPSSSSSSSSSARPASSQLQLRPLQGYSPAHFLLLDDVVRRNLEIIQPLRALPASTVIASSSPSSSSSGASISAAAAPSSKAATKGTLLGALDRTVTGPGSRLLRSWLLQPLADVMKVHVDLNHVPV